MREDYRALRTQAAKLRISHPDKIRAMGYGMLHDTLLWSRRARESEEMVRAAQKVFDDLSSAETVTRSDLQRLRRQLALVGFNVSPPIL